MRKFGAIVVFLLFFASSVSVKAEDQFTASTSPQKATSAKGTKPAQADFETPKAGVQPAVEEKNPNAVYLNYLEEIMFNVEEVDWKKAQKAISKIIGVLDEKSKKKDAYKGLKNYIIFSEAALKFCEGGENVDKDDMDLKKAEESYEEALELLDKAADLEDLDFMDYVDLLEIYLEEEQAYLEMIEEKIAEEEAKAAAAKAQEAAAKAEPKSGAGKGNDTINLQSESKK